DEIGDEPPPRRRHLHARRAPDEHARSHALLEPRDRLAHLRRRHVEVARRRVQRAEAHHREEGLDVAEADVARGLAGRHAANLPPRRVAARRHSVLRYSTSARRSSSERSVPYSWPRLELPLTEVSSTKGASPSET